MTVDPRVAQQVARSSSQDVADFVARANVVAPPGASGKARLIFALDATMSRQPTWDRACALQAGMFDQVARLGGLSVQLAYFRGISECRASRWVSDPDGLRALMEKIDCRGGHTQLTRILRHAAGQAADMPVKALVFIGDAFEEKIDDACAAAGALALRNVPVFLFQEGQDSEASRAFAEIARLTRGAHCTFDASSARELADLLKAVATYAAGGDNALQRLAASDRGARLLLQGMR